MSEESMNEAVPMFLNTRHGPIEYVESGEGAAVLAIHGAMGGYDQGQILVRTIGEPGYRYVSVSRPGYLGTPLTAGRTPEEQADLYAELLDGLDIHETAIMAISRPILLLRAIVKPPSLQAGVPGKVVFFMYCHGQKGQELKNFVTSASMPPDHKFRSDQDFHLKIKCLRSSNVLCFLIGTHIAGNERKTKTNGGNPMSLLEKDMVLSTEEAIKYLRISRPTFRKYILQGRIKGIKAGNGWRVLLSELNRFLRGDPVPRRVPTEKEKRRKQNNCLGQQPLSK